jgi:mRNA-decapping enzyme 1B
MARSSRGGFGGGGGVKVTPNLAWGREGTRMLNLSVLRRLDPAVADILITAAHVVAYSFDEHEREWVRCRTGSPALSRSISLSCDCEP